MNAEINKKIEEMLEGTKKLDLGPQRESHLLETNILASLNIAESLQYLRQQIAVSSGSSEKALRETTDKLIESNSLLAESNKKHSVVMQWLTGALIFVGFVQAAIAAIALFSSLHK